MKKFDKARRWKNVLCIYPYRYRNPYYVFPPLALEYLAGAVRGIAEKVTMIDMRFETDVSPYLKDADIVCTFGHFEDCSIFGQLKEHSLGEIADLVPDDVPLITGGTVSSDVEKTFRECEKLDVVIRGNPEHPVRALFANGSPEDVPNLVYRAGDGEIVYNEQIAHPLSNDILPAKDLRRYRYEAIGIASDIVRSSVGCNYRCRFCYQFGKGSDSGFMKWQARTAESIFEELKMSSADLVGFIDDDLLVDMDNIDRLCDLIVDSGMKKMFVGNARINHIIGREETLRKMERAGFLGISYGIESPYERTLRFYRKGTNSRMNEEGLRLAAKTNMLLICSFILGSPGETKREILDYLKFARRFDVDTAVTNRLRIPKDSELHEALFDPSTGRLRDEKYRMVQGKELEEIKYAVKYGQRTPLRILLTLLKLGRHRSLALDPFYVFTSFVRTALNGTRMGGNVFSRWTLGSLLFLFKTGLWRASNRLASTVLYWPVKMLNRVFEYIDEELEISITVLPRLFNLFRDKVYKKQKLRYGWKER